MNATTAHAAALAGAGRYDDAAQVLTDLGGHDSTDPDVLDLLARVHAQRGELADADECWAAAQRAGGDASAARGGRRRIAALQSGRVRRRPGRIALALVVAGALGAGGVAAGVALSQQRPAVAAQLDDVQRAQRDQAARLATVAEQSEGPTATRRALLRDLTTAVTAEPALRSYSDGDALTVTFPHGLFSVGTTFAPTGTAALDRLGHLLPRFGARVAVTVTGHTEDATPSPTLGYTDTVELGLARARIAAVRLSGVSGLPLPVFLLASAGAANPPYPADTSTGPALNRTVTVTVRPI
ncbi:hypothetical protein [Nocardia macrotermitis]|uniref:OmpA-like domain-containing protein n=1 Tax=Nocardia macrotermitis TaxID=2585198 RepID=A0A7K0DE04_9NOCA|nr:hypothetical protein [Nocardia macrotermitis]MQY23898.1 hypothetical protein [Nocardia macrotermitis]